MKKIMALILALVMIVSLGACGEEAPESAEPTKETTVDTPKAEADASEPAEAADVEKSEDEEAAENEKKAEDAEKTEKKAEEAKKDSEEQPKNEDEPKASAPVALTMGNNDGSVYTNEYLGLGFRLLDGWTFYSDDQLNEINGVSTKPEGEELQKLAERANGVYVMAAQGQTGSVNILVNKLADAAKDINETQYLEASLSRTKSAFEQQGAKDITIESGGFDIGGRIIPAAKLGYTVQDKRVNQTVFCIKKDGYMSIAVMLSVGEEGTDPIQASFFAMN